MFIHGREAYRRNAYLVCYNFYKNVFFVLPQYWFAFHSAFSGQPLYEGIMYQMYNIIFTSVPVMWFAIFDFEFEKETFMLNPRLYKIGLNHECFGTKVFWKWFILGAFQALVNMLVCLYAVSVAGIGSLSESIWLSGCLVYASVVLIANFKLLLAFNNITIVGLVTIQLSMLMFFAFMAFEDGVMGINDIFGLTTKLLSNGLSYFAMAFMFAFVYVHHKLTFHFEEYLEDRKSRNKEIMTEVEFEPAFNNIMEEDLLSERVPLTADGKSANAIIEEQPYHGYAFSEESNPNPELVERVRQATIKRLTIRSPQDHPLPN